MSHSFRVLVSVLLVCGMASPALARPRRGPDDVTTRVQRTVNQLKRRMAIPQVVVVALVPRNPLKASVQPNREKPGTFVLAIELGFLADLSARELEAVLAHELGHVWIYTHHPYLQTEQLANRIAMRVVSAEALAQVYGKVWGETAVGGTLASFLGLPEKRVDAEVGLAPSPSPARTP